MSPFQQLLHHMAPARQEFIQLPLIQEVLRRGASRELYLDFLGQAYHHVKCTAPLLASAVAHCGPEDHLYQGALFKYIEEERGHELWILEDIEALGGDADAVSRAAPRLPCKVMVGYAHYLVEHISPYALLGMVHVLEGMAVALASKAVSAVSSSLAVANGAGFKYLTTHSELDVEHAKFFENLVDKLDARHLPVVMEAAADFYRLYGDIFRDIDARRVTIAITNASAA
jgi:pyrroloquinoline quinone (PQQ) biosynthesis protein C